MHHLSLVVKNWSLRVTAKCSNLHIHVACEHTFILNNTTTLQNGVLTNQLFSFCNF